MKLFDDIVDLLSDDNGSLSSALLKTKVLMHRIGHKDLDGWLSAELNGYPRFGDVVPEYRKIGAQVVGTIENVAQRRTNVTLPTLHLSKDLREKFCEAHLGHSVKELEQLALGKEGTVASQIAPEFYPILSQAYKHVKVTDARSVVATTRISGILVEIRSRLLDFVLRLQGQIGDAPEDELKKAAEGVDTQGLFRSTVIGANATFIIGNQNTTTITNTVSQGNLEMLLEALREARVPQEDLTLLKSAIADDGDTPKQTKSFGPRVASWVGNMVGKAASGGWQIGIAAAGNLLSTAISGYYGIPTGS